MRTQIISTLTFIAWVMAWYAFIHLAFGWASHPETLIGTGVLAGCSYVIDVRDARRELGKAKPKPKPRPKPRPY